MNTEFGLKADGMKVMVVDDNEVNTMVVASMLEQFEIDVKEVYSGKDAIEEAKYTDYDIIFMDYIMPEMNGIEVTEEIRKLGKVKRPVIVALSANETQDLKVKFQSAGVDDVVSKPLELKRVLEIFEKWLPERIVPMSAAEKNTEPERTNLVELFSHVKELDVEIGLSHIANSEENYIKVIEASVNNIRSAWNLLSMYRESQVQPSSMKNSFHSLKGVFLNLGAKHLSDWAYIFELACTDGSVELMKDNLGDFLKELEAFLNGLEEGLQRYDASSAGKLSRQYTPISKEEYVQCLEELSYDLQKYEYNNLRELAGKLVRASKGEERDLFLEMEQHIFNFQYEKALAILNTVKQKMEEEEQCDYH